MWNNKNEKDKDKNENVVYNKIIMKIMHPWPAVSCTCTSGSILLVQTRWFVKVYS